MAEYKIFDLVGKGMTSQVYRGQDAMGRAVAVKELLPEHRQDAKRLKGLAREVDLMKTLRHPHLVTLLDYDPARFRVVLEFIPRSLRGVMQKEPFHYEKRLRWALDVTEALIALHDQGYIHKDIKPENIFITDKDRAKLGDLGFMEREPGAVGRFLLRFRKPRIQGTLAYLSPEQATQHPLTTKADIFSWGGVLYEMFTGSLPFKGSLGNPMEIIEQILSADPRPPAEINKVIDRDLDQLIMACLSKSRRSRPEAAHVKRVLGKVLGKLK